MKIDLQKPAVIVRLTSGLGNQLFQFACGLAQAHRNKVPLRCDTTWFQLVAGLHRPTRKLRLGHLGLNLEEEFEGARRWVLGIAAALYDRTRRGRALIEHLGKVKVVQEHLPQEKQSWEQSSTLTRTYLNGYWQTSDHFTAIRSEIQRIVKPAFPLSPGASALLDRTKSQKTGFIHTRRGDYEHFYGESGMLPSEYYSRALSAVVSMDIRVSKWLIFSEDVEWARTKLKFVPNAEVVGYSSANQDVEDLFVMKECAAGIIANSSYSWWGAALGETRGRPIMAPDRYWKGSSRSVVSWALKDWVLVPGWE